MNPEPSIKPADGPTSAVSKTPTTSPLPSPSPNKPGNFQTSNKVNGMQLISDSPSLSEEQEETLSMCQLASLTAAASVVENAASNALPFPAKQSNASQTVALPPISRVFPQHFSSHGPLGPNSKPSASQSQSQPQYHPHQQQQQHAQYTQGHQKMYPGAVPYLSSNSLNHYQNALKRIKDIRSVVYNPQQPARPPPGPYPVGYPQQLQQPQLQQQQHQQQAYQQHPTNYSFVVDRKRSFGPSGTEMAHSQSPYKMIKSAVQHPVKNLTDSSSHGSSGIQTKMHFRNFGIQLSAKSTNLTSNQSGSASADKEHFAAVMQDCVIATSVDFINAFPAYRPIVNNKLKPLKFIEFVQEQLFLHYNDPSGFVNGIPQKDDLVYFYRAPDGLANKKPGFGRFKVFRHSRSIGIAIYRKGERIFPVTPQDICDFWMEVPRNRQVEAKERALDDVKDGDLVMICRGYPDCLEVEADVLAEKASRVSLGGDLDEILPSSGAVSEDLRGENGTVLAVLGSEFDEYMLQGAEYRVRHVIHVEKNGHTAIDEPWSYAITKHTLVLRPYLALLYSDASKINRFSPTIEYILRKVKSAPLGESILRHLGKLSEIQHMAGAMVVGDKLRIWSTGGAFLIHLRRANPKSSDWSVSFPGISTWSISEVSVVPVSELSIQDGDCLLLCCPEIRQVWKEDEIVALIQSRSLWPEKLQTLANRLIEDRNSKNGIGFYEVNSTAPDPSH